MADNEIESVRTVLQMAEKPDKLKSLFFKKSILLLSLGITCLSLFFFFSSKPSIPAYIVLFASGGFFVAAINDILSYVGVPIVAQYIDKERVETKLEALGATRANDDNLKLRKSTEFNIVVWTVLALVLSFVFSKTAPDKLNKGLEASKCLESSKHV